MRCAVITVSDTRTDATDTGGRAIVDLLREHGHEVVDQTIVRDEPDRVRALILKRHLAERPHVQVVITTGGTGITSRDGTYEAVTSLLDKTLDGFGELFRMLSYQEIGAAAMMSPGLRRRRARPDGHRAARLGTRRAARDDEADAAGAGSSGPRGQPMNRSFATIATTGAFV